MDGIVQGQTLIKPQQNSPQPGSYLPPALVQTCLRYHEARLEMASNVMQATQDFCQVPKFIADFKQP